MNTLWRLLSSLHVLDNLMEQLIIICWKIYSARNGVLFKGKKLCVKETLQEIKRYQEQTKRVHQWKQDHKPSHMINSGTSITTNHSNPMSGLILNQGENQEIFICSWKRRKRQKKQVFHGPSQK